MEGLKSGDKLEETTIEGPVPPQYNPEYVRTVRIAAAIAVLRTKPAGMTGQQYTQYLQHKYQANQGDWRKRAATLQSQLLQARQELLQANLLQQQAPRQPSEDADEEKPEQVYPTPPSSSSEEPCLKMSSREDVVLRHSQFLACVLRLQVSRTTSAGRLHLKDTVKESIVDSLQNIRLSLRERVPDVSMATKKHVVKTIVEMLGCDDLKEFVEEILSAVKDLVQSILQGVMTCSDLSRYQHQEDQCSLVLDLSQVDSLRKPILETLLLHIKEFSDTLRTQNTSSLDPVAYENVYYMLWTFERILCSIRDCRRQTIEESLAKELNSVLEDSLLFISEKYPLFAHYIWKLGGVVSSLATS